MQPGVYDNIANADYHGGPGVSKSGLDIIRRSPMHFHAAMHAPERTPTPAQAIGTAFHMLLLEPHEFESHYVVAPKFDRRTKDGKAEYEAFQVANAGKQLLDNEGMEQLLGMAHSVRQHKAANALLTGVPGKAETSVYWNDPVTGELCRCRPDYWRDDNIVVDVKTTDDASLDGFSKSLVNWRYHVQHPFYCDGIAAATGSAPEAFVFLVVEKKPPYAVAVYSLDNESIELGRVEYRADLDLFAQCKRENAWPGYGENIQRIGVPNWHLYRNAHLLRDAA